LPRKKLRGLPRKKLRGLPRKKLRGLLRKKLPRLAAESEARRADDRRNLRECIKLYKARGSAVDFISVKRLCWVRRRFATGELTPAMLAQMIFDEGESYQIRERIFRPKPI
jgi:hypothetical protein